MTRGAGPGAVTVGGRLGSTAVPWRRRVGRCLGVVGTGAAVLSLAAVSPARAAGGVVLETGAVSVVAFPAENVGGVLAPSPDPLSGTYTPVPVEYGDTLTVELPSEILGVGPWVSLYIDNDDDGIVERTYSTRPGAADPLLVTGLGTDTLSVTLPADDGVNGPLAWLAVDPGRADRGPETDVYSTEYLLEFQPAALDPVTLRPPLVVAGYHYCATPADCAVPAGTSFSFALPVSTGLRSLGVTDLAGLAVALERRDGGRPVAGSGVEAAAVVSADGQEASVAVPAGTAPGDYRLAMTRPLASGVSYLFTEITVLPAAPATTAAPPAAAPSTRAVVNSGLRSSTGVPAPAEDSLSGAVTAGEGLLVLAAAGGVALARSRRRDLT